MSAKNRVFDWLRGGTWRGDQTIEAELKPAVADEAEELNDENEDGEDLPDELIENIDDDLEGEIFLYEYANADFRRRLTTLRKNAEVLGTEPLVGDQYQALMRRIIALEQILEQETEEVRGSLERHRKGIEVITGEKYDEPEDEDEGESEGVEVEEPDDDDDEIVGENFADLHGLDPNAEPEDVPEEKSVEKGASDAGGDARFFSDT